MIAVGRLAAWPIESCECQAQARIDDAPARATRGTAAIGNPEALTAGELHDAATYARR